MKTLQQIFSDDVVEVRSRWLLVSHCWLSSDGLPVHTAVEDADEDPFNDVDDVRCLHSAIGL